LKVLIITQYFWPENFRVNDVVLFLKKKNIDVDILTGYPNYPDGVLFKEFKEEPLKYSNYNGAKVFRIPIYLRRDSSKINLFINYISFIFSAIIFGYFDLRKKKYDIIFSFATSPITSSIPGIFYAKINKCKNFIWVLDLWPDIIKELKIINNNLIYKIFSAGVLKIYKAYDVVLVQSKSFLNILKNYNLNFKLEYFPAWNELDSSDKNIKDSITEFNPLDGKLNIVFTGNIGEVQNFENVIETALILKKNQNIRWIIVGSGRNLETLIKICRHKKINNIFFLGQKDKSLMAYYHSIADILFLSLKSGKAISSTIPGKLQTYLNANKFILGFIDGEAKHLIEESGLGMAVDPDKPELLAKTILKLENNRSLLHIKHEKGSVYLNNNFNKEKILNELIDKFNFYYEEYPKIKLVKKLDHSFFKSNFILSGLNLAFLGYLGKGEIELFKNLYNWPDGIFFRFFFKEKNLKKISGRELLLNLEIPEFIKKIYVLGNLSLLSKTFLKKKYKKEIVHIDLPYESIENIYKKCPKDFKYEDLIICTLPTPKQEFLSARIAENEKFYKILCVGGAVSMASGEDKTVPLWMDKLALEFLWRLRTETYRRSKRLTITLYYFIISRILSKYSKIRTYILG